MDAFESLMAMLLRHQGYWTTEAFKVKLTKEDKQTINRSTSPRWEVDVLAYKGSTNEVLAIECKSFLDSKGVIFRHGHFDSVDRYKLFENADLRRIVLERLKTQLVDCGACAVNVNVKLGMAIGKISSLTDRLQLERHFQANDWELFIPDGIRKCLTDISCYGYENDVAFVVSKILLRTGNAKDRSRAQRFVLDVEDAGARILDVGE